MVFYRKYRPQKVEDLDSTQVRDKLYTALKSSSVSHAFLFTGPKGLGKTSAARIVAKALNCEGKLKVEKGKLKIKGKKDSQLSTFNFQLRRVEPCNKCGQCVSITNGTNLDVLEIDGASNRGIDEIRDLREKVRLSPAGSLKKVYIIDEVHMLTQEAFNALLKTLEEPPSHVVFVLCTTEPHKVPATIKSRCLQIQFKKATEEELVRSFERTIKGEKLKTDNEALTIIASLSDGSFRDGVKILEEIALVAKRKKITKDLVEKEYHVLSIKYQIEKMLKFLEEKDTKSALEIVKKLVNDGVEMGHFMQELVATLHDSLLLKAGVDSAMQNSGLKIQNLRLDLEAMKKLIELLSKANSELKYAILPQLPLELAIVEWGLVKTGSVGFPSADTTPYSTHAESPRAIETSSFWQELINRVKAHNHSIAGVLRGCSVKSYDGKTLLLETNYKFHRDRLTEPKPFEILETAVKEIAKNNIKIEVLLKKPA